ncbi:FadR family transcriptional regulator [Mobiluncus mulieris]|uniref:FadR/GntR family transcriptional regulator n=1 Tax=Mobiluncus mulieris TaxID=2052 RepID=UPI0014701E4F|nr:FCD domain-containing protein [Mobiluncus mulieris]MCU9974880.1 FadR family transcriptional regulator [Mobiluncus mulieris]NMW61332.1 FadR family transcriptional regulator [Mobiluncus mulieris]
MSTRRRNRSFRATDNPVVRAIKDLILERGLQSGDLLPSEAELTEILDVSRASVREAIKVLSTLDIVEVRQGLGTFVSNMSLQPMVQSLIFRGALTPNGGLMAFGDIVELRAKIDAGYAGEVVKKLAGNYSVPLHRIVAEMEESARTGRPFLQADREFHLTIAKVANNLLLVQLIDAFWDIEDVVYPKLPPRTSKELMQTAIQHRLILEAAESGDTAQYRHLLRDHYRPLLESLPHPNYFVSEATQD